MSVVHTEEKPYSPGLAGVVAGETAIATTHDTLRYRGYPIEQLAEYSTYEEVVFLLLEGHLPTQKEYDEFCVDLAARREVPEPLWNMIRLLPPGANVMDVLRTSISFLGSFYASEDPQSAARDVVAKLPTILTGAWRILSKSGDPIAPNPHLGHAANFFAMLRGKLPPPEDLHTFDQSLIIYAEHEFNASTFAARVTVSTLSDLWSGITSAIGTLKGPLHGGANEEAMKMLLAIGSVDQAEPYILNELTQKHLIWGFGHRIYKNGDQRARIMRERLIELGERWNEPKWGEISDRITAVMEREKHLFPNVDFPCGAVYYLLGLPLELYTPIFVMARCAGWSAHIIEQLAHNRIFRPNSLYTGPEHQDYVPISKRS